MKPDFLNLPERPGKPRAYGLTHVMDKALGRWEIEDLLAIAGPYVDIVKLGWGTGYVTPHVEKKIKIYQDAGIPVYLGGSLFEIAYCQGKLKEYCEWLKVIGVDTLEVSNGMCQLMAREKLELIKKLTKDFTVISEVGSKDPNVVYPPESWADWVERELEAGAKYVIAEGRETGSAGIFDKSGNLKPDIIEAILSRVPLDKVIFEVPNRPHQTWFIKHYGSNVNFGNIQFDSVINLETLRLGLRSDTFHILHSSETVESLKTAN